jgi:multiple sugar transport system substrate-binding protein
VKTTNSSGGAADGAVAGRLTRGELLKSGGAAAGALLAAPLIGSAEALAAPPRATRPRGVVTITEWGFGTDNTLAKARVDAFNRQYASSIKLNVVPEVNDQKILTAVASGNVPDILWLDRASIASWAARGALEPLDDLIGKSHVVKMSQFYPAAVKQVTYSGHVWGVPQFMDVRPLWVNLDPLKQAGLTPTQVQHASWNALRADGIKLTKKRGSKVSRWGFDTKVQDGFFWMYSWGNGGDLLSADGKHASFDDARNVAALEYVVETVKSQGGLAALKAFAETWGWNAQHPFIQNQVAITLYENWLLGMIAQFAPSHNFAVYPFHGMNGKPVSLTGGLAWAIPKGAANRDAAWTFIEFMSAASTWKIGAQADKAQNGAKGAPFIPYLTANTVVDKMLMTDEYKPINAKFDRVVRLFPYLLQHGRSIPASPVYNQLNDILQNDVINPALEGSKSPSAALKDGQAKAQQAIDSFHG